MSIPLHRADEFSADFEQAYRWYIEQAGEGTARRFLEAVWATLQMLSERPRAGVARRFPNPELKGMRSFRVRPPFHSHLIFYRCSKSALSAERLMHGRRDLPRRLLEPPGSAGSGQ